MAEHEMDRQEKTTSLEDRQVASVQLIEDRLSWPLTVRDQQRKRNRDKRYDLYEEVKDLRRQGLSHYAIADSLGISRPTVRRFLAAEHFPERLSGPKARRKSIVAPYLSFLHARWLRWLTSSLGTRHCPVAQTPSSSTRSFYPSTLSKTSSAFLPTSRLSVCSLQRKAHG